MFALVVVLTALLSSNGAFARPLSGLQRRAANTTQLRLDQIKAITPFANFARASVCTPAIVKLWKCGPACDAAPQTQVLLAAGDDGEIPDFYVAYDPPSNSMVVAHQGTVFSNLTSILNDIELFLVTPNEAQFPGAGAAGVKVHEGFLKTYNRTAADVLAAVQRGIKQKGATNVKVVGHSLGAAISLLDSVHLRMKLSQDITIQTVLFGLPRVGNQEFADLVDTQSISLMHIANDNDPVPMIPPTFIGYRHPSGELFQTNTTTVQCIGQENPNCSARTSVLRSDFAKHDGPYAGVTLGNKSCLL